MRTRALIAAGTAALAVAAPPATAAVFEPRVDHAVDANPEQVIAVQLSSGPLDLATAVIGPGNKGEGSVLLGTGGGSFAAKTSITTPFANRAATRVTAGLFDNGTTNDLAFGHPSIAQLSWFTNNGAGGFAFDFAAGNGVQTAVAAVDLDADGHDDMALTNGANVNAMPWNTDPFNGNRFEPPGPNLASTGSNRRGLVAGHFNPGAVPDLAFANGGADTVTVLLDCGLASCASETAIGVADSPTWIANGDLDGDGDEDLAVATNGTGSGVDVLLNGGAGAFAVDDHYAMGTDPRSVALGDVNGDGHLDLATANLGSDDVSLRLNDGTGTAFGAAASLLSDVDPFGVQIADLRDDGDGYDDVAVSQNGPDSVGVFLNAGPAEATPTPAVLGFGDQVVGTQSGAQTVTVENTGGDALAIASVTVPAPFVKPPGTDGCSGANLPAGDDCAFDVAFAPVVAGPAAGNAVIDSNVADVNVGLSGEGITPAQIEVSPATVPDFGQVVIGDVSPDSAVTIENTGQAPATITGIGLAGADPGQFSLVSHDCGALPAMLAGGASCTAQVGFAPTAAGAKTASLDVADDTPGAPHQTALSGTGITPAAGTGEPAALAFDPLLVGTQSAARTVMIRNTGQEALDLTTVTIGGADAAEFPLVSDGCGGQSVPGGAACPVQLRFAPATAGDKAATITAASSNAADVTVALSGRGQAPPPVPVQPPSPGGAATFPDPQGASQPGGQASPGANATLTVPGRQRLGRVASRGLALSVSCEAACRIAAELLVARRDARRLGLIAAAPTQVRIGRGAATLSAAGTASLRARLTRKAVRRLRSARGVKLTVRTKVTDVAGSTTTLTRRIAVRR